MPERFDPGIVCAECDDRPCFCCEQCGTPLGICDHANPQTEQAPADPSVIEAVQLLASHGIDGAKYEALQALAARRSHA